MLDAVVQARATAVACAETPAWSLSDAEVEAALIAVHAAEQAMLATTLHLVRELDARGATAGGAASWLVDRLRMSAAVARRLVGLARAVDARPVVDEAMTAGRLDGEQATAITAALDELPAEVGPEVVAKATAMLVGWAGEFAAPALRQLGARVLAHVAPEVADAAEARHLARQEERAHAARTLSLRPVGEGRYRLGGVLDAESAGVVTAALDPLCAPRRASGAMISATISSTDVDERSPGQRRADALVEVCRLALSTAQLPANGGDRPQLTVTVAYDPVVRALGAGTLDTGARISAAHVRRLACDAQLLPAVLNGAGQVLDVGQSRRLITGAVRRALTLRDGGCAFPGCDRPPRWCEGHHIRSWVDGGSTSLDNAVLLCGRHHRVVHRGGWAVHLTGDGVPVFVPPADVDPSRRPRHNIFHDRR